MKPSITILQPLWVGSGIVEDDIAFDLPSYGHDIDAVGGYISCNFSIGGDVFSAQDWYDRLGCHVEVKSPEGTVMWEGMVNTVSIGYGAFDISRGPLLDVANLITVSYSEVSRNYTSTNITVGGEQLYTTPYSDAKSQADWGVQEILLSASSVLPGEADQIGAAYAIDNAIPRITQNVRLESGSSGGEISIAVECVGYVKMLEKYIYSDLTAGVSTSTITEKIRDVLAEDPNGIFSTDYHGIADNSTVVSRYDDTYKTARSAIDEVIPLGDASYNRYVWGVYEGRRVFYNAVPTEIEYMYDMTAEDGIITTVLQGEISPWNVLPGKFMRVNGLFSGATSNDPGNADLREEPGVIFIESISYTAPFGLQISGGRFDKIEQRLNRLGLGGF